MRRLALVAVLLAACGETPPSGFSTGPGVTSSSLSTGSSTSSSGGASTEPADDSAASASSSSSSTGVLRDVAAPIPDLGPPPPPGCQGKVDVLFVISRFFSMEAEQEQLLASFPGFVTAIEDKLADFDVHIMAANPDGDWPGWVCEKGCNEDPKSCAEYGYKCNDLAWLVTECDETLGAGLTFNAGGYAANRQCALFGGNRYIISGEPMLGDAIECIAKGGTSGGFARVGDALLAALDSDLNDEGDCNAGFLRKDALLVLVLITDVEDIKSVSTPKQQFNAVVAAKGGDPNAIVALGVIPQFMKDPHPPDCSYDDGMDKSPTYDLLAMFPYHVEGDTCADSYAPYFSDTVDLIEKACANFVPVPG